MAVAPVLCLTGFAQRPTSRDRRVGHPHISGLRKLAENCGLIGRRAAARPGITIFSIGTNIAIVETLETLLLKVRDCQVCVHALPLGARPVLQAAATARILIVSQAPGTKAHQSGIPFRDASGNRLREWLQVSIDEFYDTRNFAIIPMGLCYPGRLPAGGDKPPRPECAPLWRERLLSHLPDVRLTLLVGSYAQTAAWGRGLMTSRVKGFRDHLPAVFPLPHPSWRTKHWAEGNPWFDANVLPSLRAAVRCALL